MRYFLILILLSSCADNRKFDDKSLIEFYIKNKLQFEKLKDTGSECDGFGLESKKATSNEKCILVAKKIGIRYISITNTVSYFDVTSSVTGFPKGYAYSEMSLAPMFDNLDKVPNNMEPYSKGYKPLGGGWHIYIYKPTD